MTPAEPLQHAASPGRPAARWAAPRIGYRINALVLWVALRFLWLGYAMVFLAAAFFFVCVPRARRASMGYLDRVHGPRSRFRRGVDTFRHMLAYGVLLLDRALMLADRRHGFAMSVEGLEHLSRAMAAPPGGVLLLSAHIGVTEAAVPCLRAIGIDRPLHIVMYQDARDGTEQFHSRHRKLLADVSVVSTTDPLNAGLRIMAALQRGDFVAMRGDRTMEGRGVSAELLGGRLMLPAGPFLASALAGVPTLYVNVVRTGYRQYRVIVAPARAADLSLSREKRIVHAAADFARHLEELVRRYPLQWGNFYDLWQVQRAEETVT